MPMFRKKPVVIEAIQFQPVGSTGEDCARVEAWCGGEVVVDSEGYGIMINPLEGAMRGSPGDWIIKGVKGEFYPCRNDIFRMTYEEVLPAAAIAGVRDNCTTEDLVTPPTDGGCS